MSGLRFVSVGDFESWRNAARELLRRDVAPSSVRWTDERDPPLLFAATGASSGEPGEPHVRNERDEHADGRAAPSGTLRVPPEFLTLARTVACHRGADRWERLYRTVWRLVHGDRRLLSDLVDDDVHALRQMEKAVTRDVHKMKAFVRFRRVVADGGERFIAFHRPDHRIVRLAAPFFARRFPTMDWSILTPDETVRWDLTALQYGPGVAVTEAPQGDALEELWRTYYASIFNPARVKTALMMREMPVRHWPTLPETSLIPELLQQAAGRVESMIEAQEGFAQTAAHFLPGATGLEDLRAAAAHCTACSLHQAATQTVFGEGPPAARWMLVGEQPGDQEDRAGRPFVGPAGELLADALQQAGVEREQVYLTNVVKHFGFTERGPRRLHKKPGAREVYACRPWLEAELAVIQPAAVVCLGATAAQALLGRDFRLTSRRGEWLETSWSPRTTATWHPAAILRMPDPIRRREMVEQLISDLRGLHAV